MATYYEQKQNNAVSNFCDEDDDMLHFFINCKNVKEFWRFGINWWENISRISIKHSNVLNTTWLSK